MQREETNGYGKARRSSETKCCGVGRWDLQRRGDEEIGEERTGEVRSCKGRAKQGEDRRGEAAAKLSIETHRNGMESREQQGGAAEEKGQ